MLFEKPVGKFVHAANVIFEKEIGDGDEKDLEGGLAWSSKYRLSKFFEPGVEWHANFGELKEAIPYRNQEHQIGPVVYGKLFNFIKYDLGYLFGITDPAPEGRLKWIIEFEHYF